MASAFADVQSAPPIEVFQLGRDFAADPNPKKVTLILKVKVWRRTCFKGESWGWCLSDCGGKTVDSASRQEG